jgi:hypothetical protein
MDTDRNPWPMAWGLTGLCAFTLLAGSAFAYVGLQPERAAPPATFSPFVADDKSFACDAPGGWKKRSGTAQAIRSFAVFTKGQAKVDIDADLQGSLHADILRSAQQMGGGMGGMDGGEFGGGEFGGGGGGIPGADALTNAGALPAETKKPPIQILHESGAGDMKAEHGEYEEGESQVMQSALGEARFSEFTYKGDFFAKTMKGWRITILSGDKLVTVICESPERDWVKLKPAFTRIVASLKSGGG